MNGAGAAPADSRALLDDVGILSLLEDSCPLQPNEPTADTFNTFITSSRAFSHDRMSRKNPIQDGQQ